MPRALLIAALLCLAPVAGWKAYAGTSQTGGPPGSLTRTFTTTTTDTAPGWANRVKVIYCGAGAATQSGNTPPGGGSGECITSEVPITAGGSITYTIGSGGSTTGANGGNTTVTGAGLLASLPTACGGSSSGTNGVGGGNCGTPRGHFSWTMTFTGAFITGDWPGQDGSQSTQNFTCAQNGVTTATTALGGCSQLGVSSTTSPTGYGYGGSYNSGTVGFGAGGNGIAIATYLP